MSPSLDDALSILRLSLPLDQLQLKRARRKAQMENHPDLHGDAATRRSQLINAAFDVCLAHLDAAAEADTPPRKPASEQASPPRHRRRGGPDDHRSAGGALWAGFVVPEGTPLPRGWRRAGDHTRRHPGQPWTKLPGDAVTLRAELEYHLRRSGVRCAA